MGGGHHQLNIVKQMNGSLLGDKFGYGWEPSIWWVLLNTIDFFN
jgi:hypothetical protein